MSTRIDRRTCLRRAAAAAALAAVPRHVRGAQGKPPPRKRPNVVLIMADDLGYECIGANGSATYKTPHLDELARTGARFTHCYSQPLCTPTRVQIVTGRYNFRNYTRFGQLRRGEPTFAHMAKDAGYATGVFGKWQLAGGGGQTAPQAGFDDYCLWNYPGATGTRYADPNLACRDPATGAEKTARFAGEYGPELCARRLCDFVRRAAKSRKPFLAYYPMILTHAPFKATPNSKAWTTNRHATGRELFGDMVAFMDTLIGRIVALVDELGLRDDTLILFTGDNGTPGGIASPMRDGRKIKGGKGFHSDAGTHVPLIANWRGTIAAGQVRDDLVDTTDFLATIADAIGAKPRKPPGDGTLDGRSFLPRRTGKPCRPREWVLVDYVEKRQDGFGWPRARFVRDQRYKLYAYYVRRKRRAGIVLENKSGHLYDLRVDPDEQKPILAAGDTPETAAARRRLQAVFAQLRLPPVADAGTTGRGKRRATTR